MKKYLALLRVEQWYKNLVVFLPLLFSGSFTDTGFLIATIIGFVSLSLVSSANYIINDLKDRKKDAKHPEKRKRPIAAGKISKATAIIATTSLFIIGFALTLLLSPMFFILLIALTILTTTYTFLLKGEQILDVIIIATNFTIRAVSGAYITTANGFFAASIEVSPWLILCPFFLALLLATGKRHGELVLQKKHSYELKDYMVISATMLLIAYSLFSFLGEHNLMFLTLPFAIYTTYRYFSFSTNNPLMLRKPHLMAKDTWILIAAILWGLITLVVIII